ncbi:MAG: hypothetical protein RR806_06280 [Oscillospiraceae bacterium]
MKDKDNVLYKFLSVFYSNELDPCTSPYGDLSLSYNIWEETGTQVKVYYDGTASYDAPQKAFVKSVTTAQSEKQLQKELTLRNDKLKLMPNPAIKTHKDILDATLQYLQSSLMQDTHFESLTDYSNMKWVENTDNPSRSHYINENFMLYVAEFSADCYDYKDDSDEMEFVVYLKQIPDTQGEYQETVFKFWVLMNSGKVSYNGLYIDNVKP